MSQEKNIGMLIVLLGLLLLHSNKGNAATYTVGDEDGWSLGVSGWADGKRFKAGDILVFKYEPVFHNVVKVDKENHQNCTVPPGAKILNSGNDRITLTGGANYFICGKSGHCKAEMKIAAIAN